MAGRRVAVEGLVDLPIGRVDADSQHLDQHSAPAGHFVQARHRQIDQVDAILAAGTNGDGLHGGGLSSGGERGLRNLISSSPGEDVKAAVIKAGFKARTPLEPIGSLIFLRSPGSIDPTVGNSENAIAAPNDSAGTHVDRLSFNR